tara:strand:- start:138 stop:1805 length:1668 start_codon:yes stop_codon:yes gene_type:complete
MAEKIVIEAEVKSNVGQVSKDAGGAASQFKVMGVSLQGVKAGFISAATSAKAMFGSIKAGLISTGIGAFVVLIGSLLTFLTKTKVGAELLKTAFAGVGAAIAVLTDRISAIGGAIVKIFSGDFKGAVQDVKGAMVGIGDEMSREVKLAIELEQTFQRIADAERGLNLERAQANKIIMKARLDAEDETKSLEERIAALQKANTEELKITAKSLAIQKEKVLATIAEKGLGESLADDLDKINQEKIKLLDMETASFSMQKRLTTGIETLKVEAATAQKSREKEAADKRREREKIRTDAIKAEAKLLQEKVDEEKRQIQELIDLETERVNKLTIDAAALLDEFNNSQLEAQYQEQNAIYEKYNAIIEGKIALNESVVELEEAQQSEIFKIDEKYRKLGLAADEKAKKKQKAIDDEVTRAKIDSVTMGFSVATSLAKEGSAAAKGIAVAQTIFNTQQGIMKALADVPYPMNIVQSALTGIMGAASIAKILSTNPEGGGAGGGGGGASMSGAAPPAPQMMSGAFDLGGGIAPEATKAFVVTDEMSSSQAQLANIRRQATI